MPASARISPLRGSSAATPPRRPASADHRGLLEARVDRRPDRPGGARPRARQHPVARHAARRRDARAGAPRRPPPGRSARRASRRGSRARRALALLRGVSSRLHAPGDRVARSPRAARCARRRDPRPGPCRRASAASPRPGGALSRVSRSPSRSSGNTSRGAHSTRSPDDGHAQLAAEAAEHARVDDRRARSPRPRPRPRGRRPRRPSWWPWPPRAL